MSSPEDIFKLPEGSDNVFSGDLKKKKGKKKESGDGDIFSMGKKKESGDGNIFSMGSGSGSGSKKKKGKGKEDDVFGGIGF